MDYQERKEERRKQHAREHGKKLVTCSACSGSGYYDHNGSPPCGGCGGTGKVRETTYAAPIERKVVRHPRKGAVGVIEIDTDQWAASGGTGGIYGAHWRSGRLRLVE